MSTWRPIETAPKDIVFRDGIHSYGRYILVYRTYGEVDRVRWWQTDEPGVGNFLDGGGNAVRPAYWIPLPKPPKGEAK